VGITQVALEVGDIEEGWPARLSQRSCKPAATNAPKATSSTSKVIGSDRRSAFPRP
jgi:hypothetical protein